jgi:hypothetical protein
MVRSLIPALGSLFLVCAARADLHLTPRISQYEGDGVKVMHLSFSDGGAKEITYSPPRGWDYSGSANQLTLHPPHKSQAEATIFKVPLSQPGNFDDATVRKLADEALASVPKGATNAQLISREKNPLMIEQKETLLLTLTYNFDGQSYNRSILFLNRGKEQIRFLLTCRQADFTELHKAFLGSQFSWQNL